jgi:hypothetical protein
VALLSILAAIAGFYFTWFPNDATDLALWAGVGRGVDLVLYIWVCISLLVGLNLHLKLRMQMELLTGLARAIALADARSDTANKARSCEHSTARAVEHHVPELHGQSAGRHQRRLASRK